MKYEVATGTDKACTLCSLTCVGGRLTGVGIVCDLLSANTLHVFECFEVREGIFKNECHKVCDKNEKTCKKRK